MNNTWRQFGHLKLLPPSTLFRSLILRSGLFKALEKSHVVTKNSIKQYLQSKFHLLSAFINVAKRGKLLFQPCHVKRFHIFYPKSRSVLHLVDSYYKSDVDTGHFSPSVRNPQARTASSVALNCTTSSFIPSLSRVDCCLEPLPPPQPSSSLKSQMYACMPFFGIDTWMRGSSCQFSQSPVFLVFLSLSSWKLFIVE